MSVDSHIISHYFDPENYELYYTEPLSLKNIEELLNDKVKYYKEMYDIIVEKYKESRIKGIPNMYRKISEKYQQMLELFHSTMELAREGELENGDIGESNNEDASKRSAIREEIEDVIRVEEILKKETETQNRS